MRLDPLRFLPPRPRSRYRRKSGLLAVVLVLLGSATAWGQARGALGRLRVDFFDVGQGDAALVSSPTGKRVLVDGGPAERGARLVTQLRKQGAEPLDLILLSHRHADHLGGLPAVVSRIGTRLFLDAAYPHPSPLYDRLLTALEQKQIPLRNAVVGRTIDLGQAQMRLLSPPDPPLLRTRSDVNANSVIARIDHGRVRILMTGDAEAVTEKWLLGQGTDLRAAILKVPHHGSRYSTTARFLRAVAPQVAVISCGQGNDYGHPAPEILARLERAGIQIFRTDRDGTVTVQSDGDTIEVTTAQGRRWSGRVP